ncbi:MAG: lysophospholipid acyltransferase family protein [Gammaproteobacteria bacterium]|nr:lysophospholipid acyltransferase family protein [Gammaproteobacteria bacterium]
MKKSSFARRLRHALREPLVKILFWLLCRLPLSLNRLLGSGLGRLVYRFSAHGRHLAEVNVRLCLPELSAVQQQTLLRDSFVEAGKTLSELGPMWGWPLERLLPLVREVEGKETLDAAIAQGKGAIVLAPHLGSWELLGHYIAHHYPMTNMYRPPQIKALEPMMLAGRQRAGMKIVPTDLQGIRALLKALRDGGIIGMLPDQDPGPGNGRLAPLFGVPANTMTLLSKIAGKSGSPVFTCYAERLPGATGYRVVIRPAHEDIYSTDEDVALAALNREVEQAIRALPTQYQWAYHRFRVRPEGEASIY